MSKLLLIDGSSLLHRAFFALPLLSNADGIYTNAVHGFMMMLNKLIAQEAPDYLGVCFDKSRITFRTKMFPEYKGTRQSTPDELKGQFELIKEVLDLSHIHWLEMEDYEADDLLGTLSAQGAAAGFTVEIFSGDRDIFQLIDEHVHVFMTKKGITDIQRYDTAEVFARYGVEPQKLIDIKGFMGDTSDNIPGVPGVGEKTAIKLVSTYGSMDEVYAHLPEINGAKLKEKLALYRDQAYLSRELSTICRTVPMEIHWPDFAYDPKADKTALASLYAKLGLRQLAKGLTEQKKQQTKTLTLTEEEMDAEGKPWPSQDDCTAEGFWLSAKPVTSSEEIQAFCGTLPKEGAISLLGRWQNSAILGHLAYLALCIEGSGLLIDLQDNRQLLQEIKEVLENPAIQKITYQAKELSELFARENISLSGVKDDVSLAAYLLDPAAGERSLDELMTAYGVPLSLTNDERDLLAWAANLPSLAEILRHQLDAQAMLPLYMEMELPLTFVLADMELEGICVDAHSLQEMSKELAAKAEELETSIFQEVGHTFNLNSPKQLGVVLFEELGIPPLKKTKTGYSTDAEVMETLAGMYPVAKLLLDYRMVTKLHSTYTEGMGKLIAADGKLHTCFKQTVAATGRLSSVEPNLQNIPVRQEIGRRIRKVFCAREKDWQLLAADYNQIELRILAHVSGDEKLQAAFLHNEDIHRRTASEVLGISPEEITPEQRRAAKAVNFGIVYGISDYGLSRDLGISRKEAADYIALYFQRYPGVAAYQKNTISEARENGYAETICGRRRYLPDLNNRNYHLRSFAERMAINAPIQGSAADIIKKAMITIEQSIREMGLRSRMLLQVHDELIFDMAPEDKDVLPGLVKKMMENAVTLCIPLTVDVKIGPNWYDMEKIKVEV